MLALNRAGALTELPQYLVRPRRPHTNGRASEEPVAHWIAAIRGERRLGGRTVQCRGDFLHAARSAVVFADVLLSHEHVGGCFDPDEICTLAEVEAKLRNIGIGIVPYE
jgi:hypothetical protein